MSYAYSLSQKCTGAQQLAPWPSLNLDFANGDYLTSAGFADQASVGSADFNLGVSTGATPVFTRASGATYRYSDGYLRYAPENLLLRSQEFNNAPWSILNANQVTANASIAPDGTTTADKLVATNPNNLQAIFQSVALSAIGYTATIYAKAGEYNWLGIRTDGISNGYVWFNLSTGALGTVQAGRTGSIQTVGSGWYRCSISWTSIGGANGQVLFAVSNSDNTPAYAGDGTSGIYIWGAQLERHSSARPYISTVASQVFGPRFEYDTSGNPIGLLIEESSTNLLTYSEQFDNGAWQKSSLNTTGTPAWVNVGIAPNSLLAADKIIANTTASGHYIYNGASVTSGTTYTLSVFAKADGYQYLAVSAFNTPTARQLFNLSPSSYSVVGSLQSNVVDAKIVNAGDGWFKCSITFVATSTKTEFYGFFVSVDGSYGNLVTLQGNGTSGVLIWGAQLEAKPFATSYIPTVASTASRSADTCTISGASFTGFFPAGNLSVVSAGDRIANIANSGFYDFYSLANSFTALNHSLSSGNEVITIGVATNEVISLGAASAVNVETKIAVSHDQVNLAGSRDGDAVVTTAAAGGFGFTPDRVYIGYRKDDNKYLNGHISLLKVYDKSLESKLTSLSA